MTTRLCVVDDKAPLVIEGVVRGCIAFVEKITVVVRLVWDQCVYPMYLARTMISWVQYYRLKLTRSHLVTAP